MALSAGINRVVSHFNIMNDQAFKSSNAAFKAILKKYRKEAKDAITPASLTITFGYCAGLSPKLTKTHQILKGVDTCMLFLVIHCVQQRVLTWQSAPRMQKPSTSMDPKHVVQVKLDTCSIWYTRKPMGAHYLCVMLKKICEQVKNKQKKNLQLNFNTACSPAL